MSKLRSKSVTLLLLAFVALSAARASGQTLPEAAARTGKTWAVAVGISKYAKLPGGLQLQFADRDAALFAESLKKSGVAAENVRLLVGADATAQQIKSAIGNWLARVASEGDTVLIYFSGHGMIEREFGEAYLLAADSDAKDPYGTAISVSELEHALSRRVRAGRVLIIADAVRRDLFPETEAGAAEQFIQAFDRLAGARAGVSALLASGPGEFSREGRAWGGHGVFTKQLLDALSGGADSNHDGAITAEEVFSFTSARVAQETSNKQHPWLSEARLAQLVLSRTVTPIDARTEPSRTEPRRETAANADRPDTARPEVTQPATAERSNAQPSAATLKPDDKKPDVIKKPDDVAQAQKPSSTPGPLARDVARPEVREATSVSRPKVEPPPAKPEKTAAEKRDVKPPPSPVSPPTSERRVEPVKSEAIKSEPVKPEATRPQPARRAPAPPNSARVSATGPQPSPSGAEGAGIASEKLPPPPRPAAVPPGMVAVTAQPTNNRPSPPAASINSKQPEAGPSPTVLQLEAAISAGNLIEPKTGSAWELYQKLSEEQAGAAEASRLKPMLADALMKSSRNILNGDVRADNVADKVEDFRRAGQMLARARSLAAADIDTTVLEKLSAAQALIALQFYDEAERALAQLGGGARPAAVENALGLVFQGKLDEYQAERAYRRAIELNPNWAAPHYNLALLYKSRKNPDALQLLESASRLDPTNAAILAALGDEYFGKEQWRQAAEAYQKAVAAKPTDATLHTKLGHALYSQGLRDEANREYQKAAALRGKQ
jgi:tetratricopeptide (TPR) repeat protein/uncharacterized caspase-like protein